MRTNRFVRILASHAALVSVVGLVAVAPSRAQAVPPAIAQTADSAHGLGVEADGAVWATGRDYRARFDAAGVEFTPALGRAVERSYPWRFVLETITRGTSTVLRTTTTPRPYAVDDQVVYEHAHGIVERYDVRADGLEQSFVFPAPLPGRGDLVVRGRVWSDLLASSGSAPDDVGSAARFAAPGLDPRQSVGVHVGRVIGIDADGRRVVGTTRVDGDYLELVLPGAFVAQAAYPLVLDPPIGSIVNVSGAVDASWADTAFEASNGTYLVVWQRQFSLTDIQIYAHKLDSAGNLVGSLIRIRDAASGVAMKPAVSTIARTASFLIVWQEGSSVFGPFDIWGASLAAAPGNNARGVGPIARGGTDQRDPDVGGDSHGITQTGVVVYREDGVRILGQPVTVNPLGGLNVGGSVQLYSTSAGVARPAISKSGHRDRRWLVSWQADFSPPRVLVTVVDGTAARRVTPVAVNGIGTGASQPAVDGDGGEFLIAYRQRRTSSAPWPNDLYVRCASYSDQAGLRFTTTATLIGSGDVWSPAVGLLGPKWLVAWTHDTSANDRVYARTFARDGCTSCSPTWVVDSSSPSTFRARIAPQHAASPAGGDEALIAFGVASNTPPFRTSVRARRFDAMVGGRVVDLADGCGSGGDNALSGPFAIGNSALEVELGGGDANAFAAVLHFAPVGAAPIVCGSCVITTPVVSLSAIVSNGAARMPLPIPCDIGLRNIALELQWVIAGARTSPCPLAAGIAASNRLQATIGY